MFFWETRKQRRERCAREEAQRCEIISLLHGIRESMDAIIAISDKAAPKANATAAGATAKDSDQETKDLLEKNKRLIDEWKNGGEGDRWENL